MSTSTKKPGNTKNIILIVIAVILTIVATQNLQSVTINVLFWDLNISLILLIAIVFACGLISAYIVCTLKNKKAESSPDKKTQEKSEKKKKRFFGKSKDTE